MSENHLERSPQLYLSEIIFYIAKIEAFTKGLTREQFLKDELRVYAVDDLVRNIGEAVRVLSKHKQIRNLFYIHRIPYDRLRNMRTDLPMNILALILNFYGSQQMKFCQNSNLNLKKFLKN
jgi:uncharacterized protein with HEPN domain